MRIKSCLLFTLTLVLVAMLLGACMTAVTPVAEPAAAAPPAASPTVAPPAATAIPPTATTLPPTATPVPPTATPIPPTATPAPPTPTPAPPTATAVPPTPTTAAPMALPKQSMNVRTGPGTEYALAGTAEANQPLQIVGKNADGTWLQVCCVADKKVWVSASLVTVQGDTARVPVPADLPTPAPQPTAAPRPAAGAASGVLLYSIANMDKKRWELWEYSFATKQSRFLKEWMTEVAFSRDYKQVAYFSWGPATDNKPGICVANADLSNQRLIFVGAPSYPSFSPDGKRLAVQGDEEFYIMNSDGAGLHQVDLGEYPAWSPVDNWIAHRGCYGPDCGLWLTHADSGERRRLTKGGGDGQPAWSPDGKQLAYISKDDGNFEVYKVNRDGSERVRLTNDIHSDGLPVWSPDGSWIAFRSDRSGAWAIYVMRPDGTGVTKLVDANVPPVWFYEKMAWRP